MVTLKKLNSSYKNSLSKINVLSRRNGSFIFSSKRGSQKLTCKIFSGKYKNEEFTSLNNYIMDVPSQSDDISVIAVFELASSESTTSRIS